MKVMGLNGHHLLLLKQRLKGPEFSTHYKDQCKIILPRSQILTRLRRNLNTEITIVSPFLLTLENLAGRYDEDGQMALNNGEIDFYIRYREAYDRAKTVIDCVYSCFEPVI